MDIAMSADTLVTLLRHTDYEPESYSGRAMYGRRCVSITVEAGEEMAVGAVLAKAAVLEAGTDGPARTELARVLEQICELMTAVKTDSMGRSSVMVYWPQQEWDPEVDDPEDEDEEEDDD